MVHELGNQKVCRILALPCVVERTGYQDVQAIREGTRNTLHRALAFGIRPARLQRMIFRNRAVFCWGCVDCRAARKNGPSWPFPERGGGTEEIRRSLDIDRVCVAIGLLGGGEGSKMDDDSRRYFGDRAIHPVPVEQVALNFVARRGALGNSEDLIAVLTEPRDGRRNSGRP